MDMVINSESELAQLAKKIADQLKAGDILALAGPLAAGKTTFTRYLVEAMGYEKPVNSPTFVIEHRYPVRWRDIRMVIHLDLYRLGPKELKHFDWPDLLKSPHQLIIIEWPENAAGYLPKQTKTITLEIINAKTRRLSLPAAFN